MKKTLNSKDSTYKLIKGDSDLNNSDKEVVVNNPQKEERTRKTYKMHPLNYWAGPHFLFHITIPDNK